MQQVGVELALVVVSIVVMFQQLRVHMWNTQQLDNLQRLCHSGHVQLGSGAVENAVEKALGDVETNLAAVGDG